MKTSRIAILALSVWLTACAASTPHPDAKPQTAPATASSTPATTAAATTTTTVATATTAQPAAAAPAPEPPPDDGLNATAWFQTSTEAHMLYEQAYRVARDRLATALHDRHWDALAKSDRSNAYAKLPPAVVLDVDETVLDNSPYQARLIRDGRMYDDATWAAWVHERAARALPGALDFTRTAAAMGVRVIYLSNRVQSLDADTLANLRALGFPVADDRAILGLGMPVAGCVQKGSDKSCRRRLVGQHYRVLMQFGDQLGDFVQPSANTLAARAAAIAPYREWIGERWFVLPNPTYGSWETALFGNDWKLSPDERRRLKRQALRVK